MTTEQQASSIDKEHLSIMQIKERVFLHFQEHPSHGTHCRDMDQWIETLREQLHFRSSIEQHEENYETAAARGRTNLAMKYILRAVAG